MNRNSTGKISVENQIWTKCGLQRVIATYLHGAIYKSSGSLVESYP